jgi:hypothetical protein
MPGLTLFYGSPVALRLREGFEGDLEVGLVDDLGAAEPLSGSLVLPAGKKSH